MIAVKEKRVFIDNDNQLFLKLPYQNKLRPIKGAFKVNRQNNLIYLVGESLYFQKKHNIQRNFVFKGEWEIDDSDNLALNFTGERKSNKGRILFKGRIEGVKENSLIFRAEKTHSDRIGVSYMELKGSWRSDRFNRITFRIKKSSKPDILVFKGDWDINKNQKVIYSYRKESLKTKDKEANTLTFDGFWAVTKRSRLRYILSPSNNSFFDFRVQIESPNVYPQKGEIKYRLGIGAAKNRRKKIVSLYGDWKFSRKLGLSFDMELEKGEVKKIRFLSKISINRKDEIVFTLLGRDEKPLGIKVAFRRKILPERDIAYFLRLKKEGRIYGIEAGITIGF